MIKLQVRVSYDAECKYFEVFFDKSTFMKNVTF